PAYFGFQNTSNFQLDRSLVVSSAKIDDMTSTSSSPLVRRSSHLDKRRRNHDEELNLVIVHMEHLHQLAMQSSSLDNNVVNIFHNTVAESIK
ncbi:hypothetical protein BGX26_007475, partial [Mortierella sp. AD094]